MSLWQTNETETEKEMRERNEVANGGWRLCPIFIVPALAWLTERHFNFERMCVKIKTSHSESTALLSVLFFTVAMLLIVAVVWNAIFFPLASDQTVVEDVCTKLKARKKNVVHKINARVFNDFIAESYFMDLEHRSSRNTWIGHSQTR